MRTVRFFKGVCDTMKQDLNLPADYAVLSDNEMTYTQGDGVSALTVCAMGPLSLYLVLRK